VNTALTFVFILAISVALQFMTWTWLTHNIELIIQVDPPSKAVYDSIRDQLGLNSPFRPDLWPFDDRSMWTGRSIWSGK
jgi:hypothetical protein